MDTPPELRGRTKQYALRIIRMTEALPKSEAGRVLGRQVLRSGTSVGANYREASRGRSNAEFIAKIGDCLKELDETGYWLELISEAGLLKPKRVEALLAETDELLAIFTTVSKNAAKRR